MYMYIRACTYVSIHVNMYMVHILSFFYSYNFARLTNLTICWYKLINNMCNESYWLRSGGHIDICAFLLCTPTWRSKLLECKWTEKCLRTYQSSWILLTIWLINSLICKKLLNLAFHIIFEDDTCIEKSNLKYITPSTIRLL